MLQSIKNIQLFDGAMGTMLTEHRETQGILIEDLNVLFPDIIQNIHKSYVAAGANYITTNTFGANRIKLKDSQFTLKKVLDAAIENARQVTKK